MLTTCFFSPSLPAAYINTTSNATGAYNTSLVLDLTDATAADAAGTKPGAYGLSVPDLGELYGFSENVLAVKDYQEFKFDINEGVYFCLYLPRVPNPSGFRPRDVEQKTDMRCSGT